MLDKYYVVLPKIQGRELVRFEVKEITNKEYIYEVFKNVKKYPEIYNIDHWFTTEEECRKYIEMLNNNIENYSNADYYKFRLNITDAFYKLNKRFLQKTLFSFKNFSKKSTM